MRLRKGERGQAIILFVGIFSVILVMAAIVVDFGLWFAERRSAQRGADLAAAAGAQDLPDEPLLAFDAACDWAEANGYAQDDVEVAVFTRRDDPDLTPCGAPVTSCSAVCDTVRVTVSNSAPRLFTALSFFEIGEFKVGAVAAAGITYGGSGGIGGTGADQTVVLIDAQGRMGTGFGGENCGAVPQACPIANERLAATGLVDVLLGIGGNGQVGYAPYHNCYGPASPIGPGIGCVPDAGADDVVMELPSSIVALHDAIDVTVAYQLQASNICVGLHRANEMFNLELSDGHRAIILFSDGGNRYQHKPSHSLHPPAACHTTAVDPLPPQPICHGSRPAKSELDYKTLQMATQMKNQGVEIYVIALNPCPMAADLDAPPQDIPWQPADCGLIVPGHSTHDNVADQRLLMCIATSPEHYQRVNNVAELPDTIEDIASEIVSRSLLQ